MSGGGGGRKRREMRGALWKTAGNVERWMHMSKGMISGLLILAAFVIVLIMTPGRTSVNLFSMSVTLKTSYALLAAAGVGVVAGALLRK